VFITRQLLSNNKQNIVFVVEHESHHVISITTITITDSSHQTDLIARLMSKVQLSHALTSKKKTIQYHNHKKRKKKSGDFC